MSETSLNLRQTSASSSSSGTKPVPAKSLLKPWDFDYAPAPDGHDRNLLIMFHGLGDTKASFAKLGTTLNLPSTAVLSLQAPDPWYNTFDPLFNPLPNPDPSRALPALRQLLAALTSPPLCWALHDIHLFGWGQGGTMALELALSIGKTGIAPTQPAAAAQPASTSITSGASITELPTAGGGMASSTDGEPRRRLGSVVSICAPLLSHPSQPLNLPTPVCIFTRLAPTSAAAAKLEAGLRRAFKDVRAVRPDSKAAGAGAGRGEDMPRAQEWREVMRFWSEVLSRDERWKGTGDVYEVVR